MTDKRDIVVDLEKYRGHNTHVISGRERAWTILENEKLNHFNANAHTVTFRVPPILHSIIPSCFCELMSFLPGGLDETAFEKICRFDFNKTGIFSQESRQWQVAAFDAYAMRDNPRV